MLNSRDIPTGRRRKTGITICARLKPTCATVASMSPRPRVHHRTELALAIGSRRSQTAPRSNLEGLQRFLGEQLRCLQLSFGKALLERIAQKCLQHLQIGLNSVGPEILSHERPRIFDVPDEPRQHVFQGSSLIEILVDLTL